VGKLREIAYELRELHMCVGLQKGHDFAHVFSGFFALLSGESVEDAAVARVAGVHDVAFGVGHVGIVVRMLFC
jgi:hypothetical protein